MNTETKACDKCGTPVDTAGGWNGVACLDCGKSYLRCAECGGRPGARRSLNSHKALYGRHGLLGIASPASPINGVGR